MSQASRIIARFGGARALSKALCASPDPKDHRHWSVIYRWSWPRERAGRGGIIPSTVWPSLLKVARINGIYLTEADMSPRNEDQL